MRKICALILAIVMCLSLVGCGGADKQPAIDAFNKASSGFDVLVAKMNENIDVIPEDMISMMTELADGMLKYKTLLESDEDVTEEQVEEMIAKFAEVEKWVTDSTPVIEDYISMLADAGDKQPAIDAFNRASNVFNEVAAYINEDIESYDAEFVDIMVGMAEMMGEYEVMLSDDTPFSQEMLDEMTGWFESVEQWATDAKAQLGL